MPLFPRGGERESGKKPREQTPPPPTSSETQNDSTASSIMPPDPLVWRQEVALAAYYRWLERGAPDGADQQDWYDAEAEVAKRKPSS